MRGNLLYKTLKNMMPELTSIGKLFNETIAPYGFKEVAFDTNKSETDCCTVYLSNCCGSVGNDETMMCGECGEGCDFTNDHGFNFKEMKTKVTEHTTITPDGIVSELKEVAHKLCGKVNCDCDEQYENYRANNE